MTTAGRGAGAVTSGAAAVRIDQLSWSIGGAKILEDITMEVRAGEVMAIIGPNGAGKSTLINMVSGTSRPTAGSIHLGEYDVTALPARRRARLGLARTFQTSSLFPTLSVAENVRFAIQASRRGTLSLFRAAETTAIRAEVAALLERVGMGLHAQSQAGSLSHGDKRKLEIAMSIALDPTTVLLDEPMAGVSMEDVPGLVDLITDLNRDGLTVCIVEHHMSVVLRLAHRIAVLHHGRLLTVGRPEEVTSNDLVRTAYLGESL